MGITGQRGVFIALLLIIAFSAVLLAAPSFTDQDVNNGYVNPNDTVVVQKIMVTDGASTINSVWIKNLGSADESDITRIFIWGDRATLFDHPLNGSLVGLRTGVTFSFSYTVPAGTTYLWIGVKIADADHAHNGRTIQFQVRFYSGSYTSGLITDGSPETIFIGGFEKKADHSPSAGYLNPDDTDIHVQRATFTDDDGNASPVGITKIAVSNTKNADQHDVTKVMVKVTGNGTTYTASKAPSAADWGSGNPLNFAPTDFAPNLPASFADNSTITVDVYVSVSSTPTDKHEIQTSIALTTTENGESYVQSIQASTVQTIRVQGFEAVKDVSPNLPSGVLSPGETLVQKVMVTDDDANPYPVTITGIWIKNNGDATKADIKQIVVKRASSGTILYTLTGNDIAKFGTGQNYTAGFTPLTVDDDNSVTIEIDYIASDTITDGHTLQPEIYFLTTENGKNYNSDPATYPRSIVLHPYGLEAVMNIALTGGTVYSGQRVLVQELKCEDLDEDSDNVYINPITIRNVAPTHRCAESEVVKIEVRTKSGALLGETTDISGLDKGGVTISTTQNNMVADDTSVTLDIYVTFAGPEKVTPGHKLELETTIFSQEDGHAGEKSAQGTEWTLAINHRPICDFAYTPATNLTYKTTITFTAKDVSDPDGDKIASYAWTFSDGTKITGTGSPVGHPVTHTFSAGGTVWAQLTVTDAKGLAGSKKKTFTVTSPPVVPVAGFSWSPKTPVAGEKVTFTDESTTPAGTTITKWSWSFGDGSNATTQTPIHTYKAAGTYTVSLTVTNSKDQTDKVTHNITVVVPSPTAAFTYSPSLPHVDESIQFTDTSTISGGASITAWSWDFGDGGNSSEQNPIHKYDRSGIYQVKLTVTTSEGKTGTVTHEVDVLARGVDIPTRAYPNPAATQAVIAYTLPTGATAPVLYVYDIAGDLVYEHSLAANASTYAWDLATTTGDTLPNGLYFYIITAKNASGRAIRSSIFKLLIQR